MKWFAAVAIFASMSFHNALAFSFNDCRSASDKSEVVKGYDCGLPEEATGPGQPYSERVNGKVIWTSSRPNRHGLYEFEAKYEYFHLRGFSRRKPRIGDTVEVIIRAILYPGLVNFDN